MTITLPNWLNLIEALRHMPQENNLCDFATQAFEFKTLKANSTAIKEKSRTRKIQAGWH